MKQLKKFVIENSFEELSLNEMKSICGSKNFPSSSRTISSTLNSWNCQDELWTDYLDENGVLIAISEENHLIEYP
ncbi:Hypothetical protein KQS_01035 [Flavobacterium indicum GPTSA100-9 = DSM 17447]|uniref:Uncharacterized protein n=1 Tax=Flavobacterium indicum (strain DSM 17447 / CIP 109464 / GPTSA100-9) TaxID=1094466 RepID=H8XNT5_FLAIG|nr:hypothetical protein [Flavobacterium indicum]CCG52202.1 Hypothetical protein KQS_01035 [Flavobacterium indicum GPTSA100-9 = DSM 17447]